MKTWRRIRIDAPEPLASHRWVAGAVLFRIEVNSHERARVCLTRNDSILGNERQAARSGWEAGGLHRT